jgi:hypothetical protein
VARIRELLAEIDVVNPALLFLPQRALFHRVPDMPLEYFKIEALDVVVSKLIR